MMKIKKLPIGRTIACVIAGIFVVAGTYCHIEAFLIRWEVKRQSETRPLELQVDLSQPNSYSAPFRQTWQACHGQSIDLHIPTNAMVGVPPPAVLASLRLTWQIENAQGKVVANDRSSGEIIWDSRPHEGPIPLAFFTPFDLGDYTFKCTVVTGAPALAGLDQRLVCQYHPCGMEMLSALAVNVIGVVAFVIAGIIGLIVRAITKRKGRDQTRGQQHESLP